MLIFNIKNLLVFEQSEIEKTVVSWSKDKQKAGRELSFPELLRDLVYVLPSDLLLIVYDSNHKVILDALQDFTINSNPTEVQYSTDAHSCSVLLSFVCSFAVKCRVCDSER